MHRFIVVNAVLRATLIIENTTIRLSKKLSFGTYLREAVSKRSQESAYCAPRRKVIGLSTGAQELFQCIYFVQLGVFCPRVDVASGVSFEYAG